MAPAPVRIDAQAIRGHLRALQRIADANGSNRAAGTAGYAESARYVASELRSAGWSVRSERFRFPWWEERRSVLLACDRLDNVNVAVLVRVARATEGTLRALSRQAK